MALSFDLVLASEVTPDDALRLVGGLTGGQVTAAGELVVGDAVVVTGAVVDDSDSREAYRDAWGFDVAVSLGFSIGPGEDDPGGRHAAEDTVAAAAACVAAHLDADAGFRLLGGTKLFLRRDGLLTLYFGWRPWNEPAVLARVPAPYTIEPAPAPD